MQRWAIKGIKESVTFRLSQDVLYELESKSRNEGVSLNTLASQVLENYVQWHMRACEAGLMYINKEVLQHLLEELNEDKISKIACQMAKLVGKNVQLYMTGKDGASAWKFLLRLILRNSGFPFQEYIDGGNTSFIIQYNMGKKFSMFFMEFYRQNLQDLGINAKLDCTDKSLVIILN